MRCALSPVVLLLTLFPAAVSGEPIVIASGSFTTSLPAPPLGGTLNVRGTDGSAFEVNWRESGGVAAATCTSCAPGTLVSPVARFLIEGEPFFGAAEIPATGAATVRGVPYPPPDNPQFLFVSFTGELNFSGPSSPLPGAGPDQLVVVDAPFEFTGVLNGFDIFRFSPLLVFSEEIQGRGIAHMRFRDIGLAGRLQYVNTEYEFGEPIPEPSTLGLVAIGGALAALRKRVRRRPA